ncbi:MAG: tetratricopeptide repeat protein, partial [Alphaproteobacteria bacterium]
TKEVEIINFVKRLLKDSTNWLLIYDNVENFMEIKNYFPQDQTTWGNGRVILTTCDLNIPKTHHTGANNIFVLGELNSNEMLELFCKIMYNENPLQLTTTQREETLSFLKHIPPFPLDVSGAAYYIKNNKFSYQQYLEIISEFNQYLENSQQKFLKEISGYEKTRNGVTMSSLEKIIETNEDFQELLLLVCLVDSQSIPKKLLEFCKPPVVVDAFIDELKKYSLITAELLPSSKQIHAFSIHRSTQAIGLSYLTKVKVKLEKDDSCLQSVSQAAIKYLDNVIEQGSILEQGELSKMQPILNHYKKLLSHSNLLNQGVIEHIGAQLGLVLFCLSRYEEAQKFLENILGSSGAICCENSNHIAETLVYLGLSHKELGNYEKAQGSLERGLLIYREYPCNDPVKMARALTYLGTVYRERGNYTKANEVFKQSLEIYSQYLPEYNSRFAWSLGLIGITHIDTGNYQEAKTTLEQSVTIYQNLPIENIRYFRYLGALGMLHEVLGDYEKAEEFLEKSVKGYKDREYGEENYVTLYLTHLGYVYSKLGDHKKAKEFLDEGIRFCEKCLSKKQNLKARSYAYLGDFYSTIGNYNEAIDLITKAIDIYEQHYGKNHIETARILKMLGQAYLLKGDLEKSEFTLNKALKILTADKHPDSYNCLEQLAELYLKKHTQNHGNDNNKEQAIRYLEQALEIAKKHFPENSPDIVRIKAKLSCEYKKAA